MGFDYPQEVRLKISVNGINLAYEEAGSGPAVILIHGFPLCRKMWRPQMDALAEAGFRVIAPDLRGFGESEAGPGGASVATYADDIAELMDHLGVGRAVIVGMSMGGYVLLSLLSRYPQRAVAAGFIVTRCDGDDEAGVAKRNNLIAEVESGRPEAVSGAFESVLFAPQTTASRPELVAEVKSWMDGVSAEGLVQGLEAMRDRPDSTPLLKDIRIPTLVIGASEDRAIPLEKSSALTAALHQVHFVVIDGGGHMVNLEQSEEFNGELLDFMRQMR